MYTGAGNLGGYLRILHTIEKYMWHWTPPVFFSQSYLISMVSYFVTSCKFFNEQLFDLNNDLQHFLPLPPDDQYRFLHLTDEEAEAQSGYYISRSPSWLVVALGLYVRPSDSCTIALSTTPYCFTLKSLPSSIFIFKIL